MLRGDLGSRSTNLRSGFGAHKPSQGGETGRHLLARVNRLRGATWFVHEESMKPTDIAAPDYFHNVVDCQWACPAHTPVPEYIRLIAAGRSCDAYMFNCKSNLFPRILLPTHPPPF